MVDTSMWLEIVDRDHDAWAWAQEVSGRIDAFARYNVLLTRLSDLEKSCMVTLVVLSI